MRAIAPTKYVGGGRKRGGRNKRPLSLDDLRLQRPPPETLDEGRRGGLCHRGPERFRKGEGFLYTEGLGAVTSHMGGGGTWGKNSGFPRNLYLLTSSGKPVHRGSRDVKEGGSLSLAVQLGIRVHLIGMCLLGGKQPIKKRSGMAVMMAFPVIYGHECDAEESRT